MKKVYGVQKDISFLKRNSRFGGDNNDDFLSRVENTHKKAQKMAQKKAQKMAQQASPRSPEQTPAPTRESSGTSSSGSLSQVPFQSSPASPLKRNRQKSTEPYINLDLNKKVELLYHNSVLEFMDENKGIKVGDIILWYTRRKLKGKRIVSGNEVFTYIGVVTSIYTYRRDQTKVVILFQDGEIFYIPIEKFSFINDYIDNQREDDVFYIYPYTYPGINDNIKMITIVPVSIGTGEIDKEVLEEVQQFIPQVFQIEFNTFIENNKIGKEESSEQVYKEYESWTKSKTNPITFTYDLDESKKEKMKKIFVADQFKDFISNNPTWSNIQLKNNQKEILERILTNLGVENVRTFNPIYYLIQLLKDDVTSLSLEKIFENLQIESNLNLNIPNFLTVLILLTKKGELSKLSQIKGKHIKFINYFLTKIIDESNTDILFSIDALSSTSNIAPFVQILKYYNSRTYTSPATYADGATTDTITKQYYSQRKVDYITLLKDSIKLEIPGLLDFTFTRNDPTKTFQYKLSINKFGIVNNCRKMDSNKDGKYTIENSISKIEKFVNTINLDNLEDNSNKIKLTNDL